MFPRGHAKSPQGGLVLQVEPRRRAGRHPAAAQILGALQGRVDGHERRDGASFVDDGDEPAPSFAPRPLPPLEVVQHARQREFRLAVRVGRKLAVSRGRGDELDLEIVVAEDPTGDRPVQGQVKTRLSGRREEPEPDAVGSLVCTHGVLLTVLPWNCGHRRDRGGQLRAAQAPQERHVESKDATVGSQEPVPRPASLRGDADDRLGQPERAG